MTLLMLMIQSGLLIVPLFLVPKAGDTCVVDPINNGTRSARDADGTYWECRQVLPESSLGIVFVAKVRPPLKKSDYKYSIHDILASVENANNAWHSTCVAVARSESKKRCDEMYEMYYRFMSEAIREEE